jgi:hypothetical protein
MTDATRPLAGDPAPPLPPYFDSAPSTMKYASLDDSICLTCGKLGIHAHSVGLGTERVLHSTLDVADFAPTMTVPEHEHRWSLPMVVTRDETGRMLSAYGVSGYWPDHIFCAYPHCPARP